MLTNLIAQLESALKPIPATPTNFKSIINFDYKITSLSTKLSIMMLETLSKKKLLYTFAKLYLFIILKEEYEIYNLKCLEFDLSYKELIDQCLDTLDFCAFELFDDMPVEYFVLKEELKSRGFGKKFMFTIFE
ncbi:hypothetical protein HK103_004362 [Boothiomyces macroporosus]|uniref:Uncharacterized protein n=1 Tax=Boothiomyces macroporosus TaxID=261099 RepID=A0AAD5UHF0_9FUNG|nr:hypothetical protein HK103_004362 [Boothiomyces macroporosus]